MYVCDLYIIWEIPPHTIPQQVSSVHLLNFFFFFTIAKIVFNLTYAYIFPKLHIVPSNFDQNSIYSSNFTFVHGTFFMGTNWPKMNKVESYLKDLNAWESS